MCREYVSGDPADRFYLLLLGESMAPIYWQSLPTMLRWEPQSHRTDRSGAMPTRNVNVTEELDRFVLAKVESGRYENASEVVRAALRILEREEEQYGAKLAALRAALDEGDASRIAQGNTFARVRKKLKLPPRLR